MISIFFVMVWFVGGATMNQCDRLKLILQENKLKQKQLATELGVTESYISKLLKDPNIRLSQFILEPFNGKKED